MFTQSININKEIDSSTLRAIKESTEAYSSQIISVVLVGSFTTGEFNNVGNQFSDIDILIIVAKSVSINEQRELRGRIVEHLVQLQPEGRFGIRLRSVDELEDFECHMLSWGYDLRRFARTITGIDLRTILGPKRIPGIELLTRNLLERLWCNVLYLPRTETSVEISDGVYAASRSILDLLHLTLASEGQFIGTHWERLGLLRKGITHSWLCEHQQLFDLCWEIKTGITVPSTSETVLSSMQKVSGQILLDLLRKFSMITCVPAEIIQWFPVPEYSSPCDSSTLGLFERALEIVEPQQRTIVQWNCPQLIPLIAFLIAMDRASWHLLRYDNRDRFRPYLDQCLNTSADALATLCVAYKGVTSAMVQEEMLRFQRMRYAFAGVRMSHCESAKRDLEPHLFRLVLPKET